MNKWANTRQRWAATWQNQQNGCASSEDSDQADLSLRWAHTHFVGFVMSWLKCHFVNHLWGNRKFMISIKPFTTNFRYSNDVSSDDDWWNKNLSHMYSWKVSILIDKNILLPAKLWQAVILPCLLLKEDIMLISVHLITESPFSQVSCQMSHVLRKPVYAIYEQQRRGSACASAQSYQRLCCSLPG